MSYKLTSIKLEHIRNFKSATINLTNPLILVGQNDHGKSSILKVLDILFNKISDDVIDGKKQIPHHIINQLNPASDVGNATRRITLGIDIGHASTRKKYGQENFAPVKLFIYFRISSRTLKLQVGRPVQGGTQWKAIELFKYLRKRTCIIAIPAIRDTASEAFDTIFQELLSRDALKFIPDRPGGTSTEYRAIKDFFKKIEDDVVPQLNENLGPAIKKELMLEREIKFHTHFKPELINFVDWLVPHMAPIAVIDEGEPSERKISIKDLGNGIQSMLLFTIMRLLRKKEHEDKEINVYYAIEEPELFLHPQAQREAFDKILELTNDCSVIITTHSTILIDKADFQTISFIRDFNVFQ